MGTRCEWKPPTAPRVALLFSDEAVTKAVLFSKNEGWADDCYLTLGKKGWRGGDPNSWERSGKRKPEKRQRWEGDVGTKEICWALVPLSGLDVGLCFSFFLLFSFPFMFFLTLFQWFRGRCGGGGEGCPTLMAGLRMACGRMPDGDRNLGIYRGRKTGSFHSPFRSHAAG